MMNILYNRFRRQHTGIVLVLLLLLGITTLLAPLRSAHAQRRTADPAVYLWVTPEGNPHSNVVEPGERFYLDIQVENVGQGDANNMAVYIPYNRDLYVLTDSDQVNGLNEDEFWVFVADVLPPGSFQTETVTLRVRNDVLPGTPIRLKADYVWDDIRERREGTSDEATVWVDFRDDDNDGDDEAIPIVERPGTTDSTPPTSCMLGVQENGPRSFSITWGGNDNASGIESYDVQIMQLPNGLWRDWKVEIEDTTAVFGPVEGAEFGFRVRARDNAGNVEAWPINPEMTTSQANLLVTSCPNPGRSDVV
jgi:hypothetical protein